MSKLPSRAQVRIEVLEATNKRLTERLNDTDDYLSQIEVLERLLAQAEMRGCQCSDDEACRLVRERDKALADVARLKKRLETTDFLGDAWTEMYG